MIQRSINVVRRSFDSYSMLFDSGAESFEELLYFICFCKAIHLIKCIPYSTVLDLRDA